MVSHFLFIVLTLGVATLSQPAGGLVLREQRSDLTKERTTWKNPTEAHLDLSGTWQWRTAKDEVWHSGWIPSCYDDVQGEVIFQREFSIPDSLRHWHFHLVIPQVNYKVRIIINGKFIESVAGNHLGFVLDVPSQLLRIRLPNTIELHIDNRLSPKTTLPLSAQLYAPRNFGGIPSGCYLWVTPPWAVEGVVLQWPVGNSSIGAVVLADISRA
ncbi:MAG: hypothetical protein FJY66_04085, partial [Calditrichaeota bacterium]|nr:hypothetical protein [Calditrichota bacterium]